MKYVIYLIFYSFIFLTNIFTLQANEQIKSHNTDVNQIPLFKTFSNLQQTLPYINLGSFPTPIFKAYKLNKLFKDVFEFEVNNLYIKNDGLSGKVLDEETPLFGGNKVRKLEFLLADAINAQAETVLTVGSAGSNHALATSIYSQLLGLDCIIMLTPQLNTSYTCRNLLMDLYYNPKIKAYDSDSQRQVGIIETSREFILQGKKSPYFIPSGGSNEIGIIGFVNAAFELKEQINKDILPEPDFIYVTLGSCGTFAGLILGIKLAGLKTKIVAVNISGEISKKEKSFTKLIEKTNNYLHALDNNIPILEISKNDYILISDFAGEKYAQVTKEGALAIRFLRAMEKIQLDGTYTGKTFAALLFDLIKKPELRKKTILFWDTFCSGSFSDITKQVNYKDLPETLQVYFNIPIQALDQGC